MRLYRALLHLYPRSFRQSYGDELCAIFARRRLDVRGLVSRFAFWAGVLGDTAANAARVHAEILAQDLRHALRALRRMPGFATTAIFVIALGIGATTAAFSVADHVLFRPFAFADADRLLKIWEDQRERGYPQMELSPGNYRDWKAGAGSFEAMAAYRPQFSMNLTGAGDPARLDGALATPDLFKVLGRTAALGRVFTDADDRPDAPNVAILSDRLWRSRFGADPSVIGRRVRLNNQPHEIIGVMPPGFDFPTRQTLFLVAKRFQPEEYEDRADTYLLVLGKLKRGVSIDTARSELNAIAAELERRFPVANEKTRATVNVWRDEVSWRTRQLIYALVGAAACLLLIACTNLASLLLTRAGGGAEETEVRVALGAGRGRLVRQLLTEAAVLSTAGGLAGLALAVVLMPLIAELVPTALPIAEAPALDWRLLATAAAFTLVTGLGFGVWPALRAGRNSQAASLTSATRVGTVRQTERARRALVVVQVTVSVVLLVTSGLLLRALWSVRSIDPGFNPAGVAAIMTSLPLPKYAPTAARLQLYDRVLSEVRAVPGVAEAAYATSLPMVWRGGIWPVNVPGRAVWSPGDAQAASLRYVTPGFFKTMGIPIVKGRDVRDSDTRESAFVALVSESFASAHWPGQDAIGRQFEFAFSRREVAGVVGDVRVRGLERESEPQVYVPASQVADNSIISYVPKELVVKSSLPAGQLAAVVRQIVSRADPELPVSDVKTLSEIVEADTTSRLVQVRVLVAFALVALILAGVGIHGLLAFSVSTRAREIGLRLALGAAPGDVVRLMAKQTAILAGIGLVAGVGLAYLVGGTLRALLAGIEPADFVTFAAAGATLALMTIAGSLQPIRRAVKLDPARVLKE